MDRLDYSPWLERERIQLVLLDEVEKGLADVTDGRTRDAREALGELKRFARRAARTTSGAPMQNVDP